MQQTSSVCPYLPLLTEICCLWQLQLPSQCPDLSADDYIVIGLATCFIKEEGEVHEVQILEPIPSAAMEAIAGRLLPYQLACATTLELCLLVTRPKCHLGLQSRLSSVMNSTSVRICPYLQASEVAKSLPRHNPR